MFKKIAFICVVSILLLSCNDFQKYLKSDDYGKKYRKAVSLYEEQNYYKALQLFDQLIAFYRGTEKAEKIYYYYAYSYYNQDDFMSASYYFKRFVNNFPTSPLAEECSYLSAYCKYLDSPKYSLDQTNTYSAIKELQLFINKYPESEKVEESNKLMDILRAKLEKKEIEIATLYMKMEDYQASITSFNNTLKEYPGTDRKEDVLFYVLKSSFKYAINSVDEKKEERLRESLNAYNEIISSFPETDYKNEADKMQKKIIDELKKYNK